ncbi:carboxypeptidase regulatory-like domain-containing protein [Chitinophaga lutea]
MGCRKSDKPRPAEPGVVAGSVTGDHGQLVKGAEVSIEGGQLKSSFITKDGSYLFDSVPPGSYRVSVKKNGYIDAEETVTARAMDTVKVDILLKAGTAYFGLISDSIVVAHAFESSYSVKIASNAGWTVTPSHPWMTVGKEAGGGDDSVVVRLAASPDDTARVGQLTLRSGSTVKKVVFRQLADVNLKMSGPIAGNSVKNIADSAYLIFNQPVTISSMTAHWSLCLSEMRFSSSGNRYAFSYACGALGGEYPFTVVTKNSLGDQYTFNVVIRFYDKGLDITGGIRQHVVNDADQSYWILTDHPNALYKIDMNSLEILHRYELPAQPVYFTLSPYDGKIYIAYDRVPKLYVMNESGVTEKVIDITATRGYWGSNGPLMYPSRFLFTKSGKGLIWLGDISGSRTGYYSFIDAADNHRIWYESLPGDAIHYWDGYLNYDKSAIVLTYLNSDPTIGMFDPQQMKFTRYSPRRRDIGSFLTPSRKGPYIYSGQYYYQSVWNYQTGSETQELRKDIRFTGGVDFSYKPGGEQMAYVNNEGKLELIDFTDRSVKAGIDVIYMLQSTTTALDGKFLILSGHDGNYRSKVVKVPAAWFVY